MFQRLPLSPTSLSFPDDGDREELWNIRLLCQSDVADYLKGFYLMNMCYWQQIVINCNVNVLSDFLKDSNAKEHRCSIQKWSKY